MKTTQKSTNNQNDNRFQSLYDLGYFDSSDEERITGLLAPLGIGKQRPLIVADHAAVFRMLKGLYAAVSRCRASDNIMLLAYQPLRLDDIGDVFCGWKEKDENRIENYCLGIMDLRASVAGEYYRCRKEPDKHRTRK